MTKYTKTLDKLQLLIELVEETESDEVTDNELFDDHLISASVMMNVVRDFHTGKKMPDADTERETLAETMKAANKIWRIRNKIKNGAGSSNKLTIDFDIEDFIKQDRKLDGIKHYRSEMEKLTGDVISLKTSKEYVDIIYDDMKRRGLIL
jgi:hypothetical protein